MKNKRKLIALPFAVLALGLSSCGGDGTALEVDQAASVMHDTLQKSLDNIDNTEITIKISDLSFNAVLSDITVPSSNSDSISPRLRISSNKSGLSLNLLAENLRGQVGGDSYISNKAALYVDDVDLDFTVSENEYLGVTLPVKYSADNLASVYLNSKYTSSGHEVIKGAEPTLYFTGNNVKSLLKSLREDSIYPTEQEIMQIAKEMTEYGDIGKKISDLAYEFAGYLETARETLYASENSIASRSKLIDKGSIIPGYLSTIASYLRSATAPSADIIKRFIDELDQIKKDMLVVYENGKVDTARLKIDYESINKMLESEEDPEDSDSIPDIFLANGEVSAMLRSDGDTTTNKITHGEIEISDVDFDGYIPIYNEEGSPIANLVLTDVSAKIELDITYNLSDTTLSNIFDSEVTPYVWKQTDLNLN